MGKKLIDLTGSVFGSLVVTQRASNRPNDNQSYWQCKCSCGRVIEVRSDCLRKRGQKSCGCDKLNFKIGDKIGLLTVLEASENTKSHPTQNRERRMWKCQCECGNVCDVTTDSLTSRSIKSCGCLIHSFDRKKNQFDNHLIKHWLFARYERGARQRRLEFDITQEYVSKLFEDQNGKCSLSGIELTLPTNSRDKAFTASLDRIDSTKGYVEGNCQWIHKDINWMKNKFDQEDFIQWCKLIVENTNGLRNVETFQSLKKENQIG